MAGYFLKRDVPAWSQLSKGAAVALVACAGLEVVGLKGAGKLARASKNLSKTSSKAVEHYAKKGLVIEKEMHLNLEQAKIVLSSCQESYKGSTKIGHALSKHAQRFPETWGPLKGNLEFKHMSAMNHLREIYRAPEKIYKVKDINIGNHWIEKRIADGRGIRLNCDYTFKGFID